MQAFLQNTCMQQIIMFLIPMDSSYLLLLILWKLPIPPNLGPDSCRGHDGYQGNCRIIYEEKLAVQHIYKMRITMISNTRESSMYSQQHGA